MNRYSKREIAEMNRRCSHLRSLLAEFGATLSGFDPGVSAWLPKQSPSVGSDGYGFWGEGLSFNRLAWNWLEPLLLELREVRKVKRRRKGKKLVKR